MLDIFRIKNKWERPRLGDVREEVRRQLQRLDAESRTRPGQQVAIAVGSRGIRDLVPITASVVRFFQEIGLQPFIVTAMGSHGGATSEGQRQVLKRLGITEASVSCPIRADMETKILGTIRLENVDYPVYFDRTAAEADHVFLINRIKPHTRFSGPIESGLLKMLMIGLGNHAGAASWHQAVADERFSSVIQEVAALIGERLSLLGGLGIVENGFEETAVLAAATPETLVATEMELLQTAKRLLPRLPFDHADLLLIDRIGKEISGTGMDTNVVGRKSNDHKAVGDEKPVVRHIAVRGLTETTHGNANGIGMAEFCRSDLLPQIDITATRINAMTANHTAAAMIPLDYPTDRAILEAADRACGNPDRSRFRLLWIADTLHLEEIECSTAYLAEATARGLDIIEPPRPLPWDHAGNLPDFWPHLCQSSR